MNKGVYRARELSRTPLPIDALRFASPREETADALVRAGVVHVTGASEDGRGRRIQGRVRQQGHSHIYTPAITVDSDERLAQGECSCNWYSQNKLHKGPCEHMIALRMQYERTKR